MRVRRAVSQDIPALLSIKQRLAFKDSVHGGFLLGCDELEESYPGFGPLTSDIWILSSEHARRRVHGKASRAARWVEELDITRAET